MLFNILASMEDMVSKFSVLRYISLMRVLGIDYGAKNVGVALSDERGDFSYPLVVLQNTEDLIEEIKKICLENAVGEIVVGESKNFSMEANAIMKDITPFVETLKTTTNLPVHLHPEFLTSMEAERLQGHNDMHDASAAALILKSYLETKK
jgi:putative Holliday junction resolvase